MPKPSHIREQELHYFWAHSRYFNQPLLSTEKQQIEIVQRGRHNLDAGPDFTGAVVKIDNKLYEGDVEIHVDARDWVAHGHDKDPAYNNVILHISLDLRTAPVLRCENGRNLLCHIIPTDTFSANKNTKAAKHETMALQFCPLSEQPIAKISTTVLAAGRLRFAQKTDRFREQFRETSWDQMLYQGICEALGYAKNQKPFRRLAAQVPIDLLFSELRNNRSIEPEKLVSALLFGAAGLLKAGESGISDAEITAYLEPRREIWRTIEHTLQIQALPEASWQFFRLRPANFPTRRIAALAALILKFYQTGMLETIIGILGKGLGKVKASIKELRELFAVPATGFWQHYYDFRSKSFSGSQHALGALIGERAADEIIVNIVLPIASLFAQDTRNAALGNRIAEIYSAYPRSQENEITRKMRKQLFADNPKQRLSATGAEFQQGLLHLHKNFCQPLKCEECLRIT